MSETTDIEIPATGSIDAAPVAETPAEGEHQPSPREQMMARIVERAAEQRSKELAYGEELSADARDNAAADESVADPASTDPDPAVAAVADAVQTAITPPVAPEPQRHLIEVGGQQFQVTDEEYRQLATMGAVANIAIRQQQNAPQPTQPLQAPQQAAQPPMQRGALDEATAREFQRKFAYGSEQEGIQAVQELAAHIAAQSQPQVDPNRIVHVATQQALQQIQLQDNLNKIGAEFPEIFANNSTSQLAALKLHEIRRRDEMLGVQKPDLELYREACQMVVDDARRLTGQPRPGASAASTASQAAPGGQPMADRLERKRAAPRQPAAISRTAATAGEQRRAPSGSEIVEAMRKARYQPPMH